MELSEKLWGVALLGTVFLAVMAFGASDLGVAALFSFLHAALLALLLATSSWARRDLRRLKDWKASAILFAILMAAVLWPLTPWGPGGPHPAWSYLPKTVGSLTLDRSALVLNVVQFLGLACLFVTGRIMGLSEARARWFLRAAVFAVGAYAAAAFLDQVSVRRAARLTATLLSPNSAATVLGGGLLLSLGLMTHRFRRNGGLINWRNPDLMTVLAASASAALAVALLLTASRGGIAAVLIGGALFLIWETLSQRHQIRASVILGSIAAVLLIAALILRSADGVAERLNAAARDADLRAMIFSVHWEAFRATPWSGFGLGAFPTVNQLVMTRETLPALFDVRAVHNLYLQWLEEGGVVGSMAMLALFLWLAWPILKGGFRSDTAGIWCRATLCAAVAFLIHGITDFGLQVPAIQALATMILGVVGGMVAGRRGAREALKAPEWPVSVATGGAMVVGLVALLVAAPLIAGKAGADLADWPTAPADALARAVEIGLAKPDPSVKQLRRLDRLSTRELAMRPASGAAWLRRAAVDVALDRNADADLALQRSFAVSPLQTSLFTRRTLFAYENWDRLSRSSRDQTIYQMQAEWRRRPARRQFVAMANSLHNPAGRVGMALQITALQFEPKSPLN
ncbi:O-antigen ligase family protein [Caulobacter sp.]|uniref:O-antigen ligase family protein n=1 Tax=Caulobacter sp. TaxID=78 RepID=UPI003BAFF019